MPWGVPSHHPPKLPPPASAYPHPLPSYIYCMVHNIADITPNSTATALSASHTRCNWIMISAPTGNAGDIRIGDSTTSASSGTILVKGNTITLMPIGDDNYLDLALIFVFGTSTDKVGITWASH